MKNILSIIFSIIFVLGLISGITIFLSAFAMMLYIFGEGGDPGDLVRFIMNHNSPLNISILVILTVLATLIGNYKKSIPNKLLDRIEKIFA